MARIVKIGKRQWLAGMYWNSFEAAPNKAELKETAQSLDADWVAIRVNESAVQVGFTAPIQGIKHPANLYSLAAKLADSHEQPWLGIFQIDHNTWWYIAVRDGHAILPEGDIIGTKEEILAARDRHSGYTDWNYIEGDFDALSQLVSQIDAKATAVKSLTGFPVPLRSMIITSIVSIALLGGGYYWWTEQQKIEAQAKAQAIAKMRAQLAAGQPVTATPSPLISTPNPNEWLRACNQIIATIPLSKFGWKLDTVSCNTSNVIANWTRNEGATVARKPDGVLNITGDKIEQTLPLEDLDTQGQDNAISLADAKLQYRAWAQAAGFSLLMLEAAPPAPLLPGAAQETLKKMMNEPAKIDFKLEVPVSPFALDLNAIPGLRMTELKSTETAWKLEGVLYGTGN